MNDTWVVKQPFLKMILKYVGLILSYQELSKPEKYLLIKVQRKGKAVNFVFKSVDEWATEDEDGIYKKEDIALLMILLDTEKYLSFDMYEVKVKRDE